MSEEQKQEEIEIKEVVAVKSNRGLARASPEVRHRVASSGGSAPHEKGKRGLQASSQETKDKVSKLGGEARAKDRQGLSAAGTAGGNSVLQRRGRAFYSEIGARGGGTTKQRYGSTEHYSRIGKLGGRELIKSRGKEFLAEIARLGRKKEKERRDNLIKKSRRRSQ